MPQDILIVEDNKHHLESLRLHVQLNLNIDPFVADDPVQALDILKFYPVKVLVTDWDLPRMNGVELFQKVKEQLNREIPCILVSGHADRISMDEAVNAGFFRFIDKLQVESKLAPVLRDAMMSYERNNLSESILEINVPIATKRRFSVVRPRPWKANVKLTLVRIASINETSVKDSDWRSDHVAARGIVQKKEVETTCRARAYEEYGLRAQVVNRIGFSLPRAVAALEAALGSRTATWAKQGFEHAVEVKAKYTIEIREIPHDTSAEAGALVSREYQSAPVYAQVNCIFRLDCDCCQVPREYDVALFLPTTRIALRQVEHYEKAPALTIYTGFLDATTT